MQVLELSRGATKNVSNGTTQQADKQGGFHTLSDKISVTNFRQQASFSALLSAEILSYKVSLISSNDAIFLLTGHAEYEPIFQKTSNNSYDMVVKYRSYQFLLFQRTFYTKSNLFLLSNIADPLCFFGNKRTTSTTTTSNCSATTDTTTTSTIIDQQKQTPKKEKVPKSKTSRRLKHTIRNVRTSSITSSSKRTSGRRGSNSNGNDSTRQILPKFRSSEKPSKDGPLPNFRGKSRVGDLTDLTQTQSEVYEVTITSDVVK